MTVHTACLACLVAAGLAHAQPAGNASYIIDVADPVLAPGQSTPVVVRVAFEPGIGQVINPGGIPGEVLWVWSGGFGIAGGGSPGVTGAWSGNTVDPPYHYFGSPGTNIGPNVSDVIWAMPTLLIHPNPANPETVWRGTFTAGLGSDPGVITFSAEPSSTYPVTVIFGVSTPMMAPYQTAPGPGAQITIVCYADCDTSGTLTVADFACFQSSFAAGQPYADCDGSTQLTIADFACFQNQFAAGCP